MGEYLEVKTVIETCESSLIHFAFRGKQYPDIQDVNSVHLKVGMVGDSQIGKTSLMVKYVEGSFE